MFVEVGAQPFGEDENDQVTEGADDKDHLGNELTEDVQPIVEVSDEDAK